ncbi:MAG TPA: hypothetical protein VHW67_09220 [Solirubrobacteraceae bacterium]|nr:hypothetical protein [Solirubrobacteraceae bacterium]
METTVLAASPETLESLRALLLQEGGLLASLVQDGAPGEPRNGSAASEEGAESPARTAARGPRTERRGEQYELLVETIYEGYLLHYGAPRVVRASDADLRVLAGDRLYALGLARLVELGDTPAVAELADTITLSALAQGTGDVRLADAVWAAGARAVGWGPSEQHARAKELVANGADEAFEAMRTSAAGPSSTP